MKPILFSLALLVVALPGLAQSRGSVQYDSSTLRFTPRNALASNVFGAGGIKAVVDGNGGISLDGSAFVQPTNRAFYALRASSVTPYVTAIGTYVSAAGLNTPLVASPSNLLSSLINSSGAAAYISTQNNHFHPALNPRGYFWCWPQTCHTNWRTWTGFASATSANLLYTDAPEAYHVAAFRYSWNSTGTNDANFTCVTADGAGATYTDSGVAFTTNRTQFAIFSDWVGRNMYFYINGACVATNTAHLPNAAMQAMSGAYILSTPSAGVRFEQIWIDQLIP